MKLKQILTDVIMFSCLSLSIAQAYAETVPIEFDSCNATLTSSGQAPGALSSLPFVFTKISLGHACGTIQGQFLREERKNNDIPAGTTCVVRATLQSRTGEVAAGRLLTVRDHRNHLMARGRTHANGAVRFRFRSRSKRTIFLVLRGPPIAGSDIHLACFVYITSRNCIGSTGGHARVC